MKFSLHKKRGRKVISFLTAVAILTNAVPLGDFSEIVASCFSTEVYAADESATDYAPNRDKTFFASAGNSITFDATSDFIDYSYYYNTDSDFAAKHCGDRLVTSFLNDGTDIRGVLSENYMGLGTEEYPFNGTIALAASDSFTLKTHKALFNYMSDSVKIIDSQAKPITLTLLRLSDVGAGENKPLLADHVVHTDGDKNEWIISDHLNSLNGSSYSGVIGEIHENASVNMSFSSSSTGIVGSADIGAICGTMKENSSLNLDYDFSVEYSISSSDGNAGGLVGTMENGSELNINSMPVHDFKVSIKSENGYAGGIVGEMSSKASVTTPAALSVSAAVNGKIGAGGVFGHYVNYGSDGEFDLAKYSVDVSVYGEYCGGIFGVLENNIGDLSQINKFTIKNSGSFSAVLADESGSEYDCRFGGITGKYVTDDLRNSLLLSEITVETGSERSFSAFGGVVGLADSAAYIKADNVEVTASGTDKGTCFGGLVGETSDNKGVFADLGNFTLKADDFNGGGIVGKFNNGVLRLHGTTDMSAAKLMSGENCGQLVGYNNNVFVYALGSGSDENWTFNRSNGAQADDLGTWGEVVRLFDGKNAEDSRIVTFDESGHFVTLDRPNTSIGTTVDFAKTALNIMLDQGVDYDCLKFADKSLDRSALLSSELEFSADIDLSGTGINGFMRDGSCEEISSVNIGDVGAFVGTLNGGGHTLTLAIGETYGNCADGQTECVGQMYSHQYNGLFSVVGDGTLEATVNDLKINGTIRAYGADSTDIGGIAARSHGSAVLDNITAEQSVELTADKAEKTNIGGFIGYIDNNTDNGTINIKGNSAALPKFNFSEVSGGVIGKVDSSRITINIAQGTSDKLLVGARSTDLSDSDSYSGSLIGYITSNGDYKNRVVNIDNLESEGGQIGGGGGFLGYSWLDSTVNIAGLTVTGGTITTTAKDVGVMCYSATGKWTVDSLSVSKMSLENGGSSSVGMIVNKAYDGSNGLYIDLLDSGYKLNESGILLPQTGKFDEIAAYSAENVLDGGNGAGVISIDMNPDRNCSEAKFTETGTYQNRISAKKAGFANSSARYYYNLNNMNSADAGQNLLLWSVNKYAAGNIKDEFTSVGDPFTGNADMTGLSLYPIKNAPGVSIGEMTLTFDYSGIYSEESGTENNSDSYVRDPAELNQHYLMHSGLFIDLSAGESMNVNGKFTLGGTFLELSDYSGVIINQTMYGNFIVSDSGAIVLDGIRPMTSGNKEYSGGYLLINSITRKDDLTAPPSLTVKNLSSTNKYSSDSETDKVAKSLIGSASGKGLKIVFSGIKLDSRNGESTDTDLAAKSGELYNAYGTYNSIFTDSTLLASIKTDQSAKLEYNFTKDEDWGNSAPRSVTYGKEIKDSIEYKDEEQRYYPDANGENDIFTNPVNDTERSEVYDFSVGFLPYVKTVYSSEKDGAGLFYRELKVNVQSVALNIGCGTYNDPYIINDAKVLEALAEFISSGDPKQLQELVLPRNAASFDSLNENISGARWDSGDGYHAVYKANETQYTSSENGAGDWKADNARLYLVNAYYEITDDISLSDKYIGLGCSSDSADGNYAFRGVIVGRKNDGKVPVITNKSESPLIKVSNGSVVKDVNVVVNKDIALSQAKSGSAEAYFGYGSQCAYYGGIIGEIMGGDNIIDNSYVYYNAKVTLSGAYGAICPVGSYVGVIVYGGLVFKNINAELANSNAERFKVVNSDSAEDTLNFTDEKQRCTIYANPLVGRVINGYAVNETTRYSVTEDGSYHDGDPDNEGETTDDDTSRSGEKHSLKNGIKHYSIADIDKNDSQKLSFIDNSTIELPDSQSFFILSLITQSMAGTAQTADGAYVNSLSYGNYSNTVFGMSHNADYTDVGSAADTTNADYSLACYDTAANTAVPYIIRRYTEANGNGNYPARCVTSDKVYYDINLYAGNSYVLPDSFRGIGSVGNNSSLYSMKIDRFNGNGCTVDVDIYLNRYGGSTSDTDNYFDKLHKNKTQGYQTSIYDYVVRNSGSGNIDAANGIGLFDRVVMKDKNSRFIDFTIRGSVNTESYGVLDLSNAVRIVIGKINDNFLEFDENADFDGKILLISNNRPDSGYGDTNGVDWYLSPLNYKKRTKSKQEATQFLFTRIKDGDNKGTYIISCDSNGTKYLAVDCTLKDSPTYFTLEKNNNQFSLWSEGKHIDQNNNNGYGYWNEGGNGSYLDFTECEYITEYNMGEEKRDIHNKFVNWLYSGGVCGWSDAYSYCGFEKIKLSDITVSGATNTAGILASSSLDSKDKQITVKECSADELSVEITSFYDEGGDFVHRNNVAAFVGKCDQGKVVIDGGESGSKVKLKAVKIGSNGDRSVAGGLVGYAGNGCEVSNMTVCSADSLNGKPLTIGAKGIRMSGGIVGLMQPQSDSQNNCYAYFENCVVENINVYADSYAGGFYGGSWDSLWTPYSIRIENCKMIGDESKNSITAGERAGGFVADGYVAKAAVSGGANIEIANSVVSGYTITTTKNDSYSGGFIGYAKCQTGAIVCDIYNCSVENCVIAANGKYGGGALGFVNKNAGNKILGYNIKLDNVTSTSDNMGAWVGYLDPTDTDTSVQFSGMAIYGNGFTKNIGNGVSLANANFVFADYTGKCRNSDDSASVSDYNNEAGNDDHVEMPKAPYVNINPYSGMGSGKIISGDGAVLYGSDKTMAEKIYSDISDDSNSRHYTAFTDSDIATDKKISYYFSDKLNSSRISTYKNVVGELPDGVDDFPVIVIANKNDDETTNLIDRYIQLVTNTSTEYTKESSYYSIDIQTCGYRDGAFAIDKNAENHGLILNGGKFSLDGANADSNNRNYSESKGKNVFTLVDVQFKDPLHTSKTAYHLYVPVYTVKQMEANFSATAETGVDSAKNGNFDSFFENEILSHVDNVNTWLTQYVRFSYNKDDINELLAEGNVDWNHEKKVIFKTQNAGGAEVRLPEDTFMVLVDPNGNRDAAYYAKAQDLETYTDPISKKEGWLVDFKKFKQNDKGFEVKSLNDVIARQLKAENSENGSYNEITSEVAADPNVKYDVYRIDDSNNIHYYKFVSDGTGNLDLSVTDAVNEDYYISIYVPGSENAKKDLYYYTINAPDELDGEKIVRVNNSDFNVLVSDLYTQETKKLQTTDQEQITSMNRTISVEAETSITLNNPYTSTYLEKKNLFHSFVISLNRYTESGVTNEIYGLDTSNVSAKYRINSGNWNDCSNKELKADYLNVETKDIMEELCNSASKSLTIYSDIKMTFDDSELDIEFPMKDSDLSAIGVNVAVTSNLAYNEERLVYSSMSKAFDQDRHYYYIESVNTAKLIYESVNELDEFDMNGKASENKSRLGINGKYSLQDYMPINTQGNYNVSNIPPAALNEAKYLRLTISLSKKTDTDNGAEYVQVSNMGEYLSENIQITSGNYSEAHSISGKNSLQVNIPVDQCDFDSEMYNFNIGFAAKTGADFHEYANYKVTLRAELLKDDGTSVENSSAGNYIVYTNAKVYQVTN